VTDEARVVKRPFKNISTEAFGTPDTPGSRTACGDHRERAIIRRKKSNEYRK
jgi:hypothetical protein